MTIRQPSEFSKAQDSRRIRRVEEPGAVNKLAVFLYRISFKFFFIGAFLAIIQLGYQSYYSATTRVWHSLSALTVLESYLLIPLDKYPSLKVYLNEISFGVLIALLSLVVLILVQFFMPKNSR